MTPTGMALVGAGPWGLTLGKAFAQVGGVPLRWVCDLEAERLERARETHPVARLTSDLSEVLSDGDVCAVAVAVDPIHQYEVGRRVLAANRHLFLEKPMALSAEEGASLVSLAADRGRLLVVDYLLLHHPAVRRAQQILRDGILGRPLYFEASRIAPGTARAKRSAWWTLAPHDISLALHLFGQVPATVSAAGGAFLEPAEENVAFATLRFADGRLAHIDVARIAAEKRRHFSIAGAERALTFDELDTVHPLRLHSTTTEGGTGPRETLPLDRVDPLSLQCRSFLSAVLRNSIKEGNGAHALDVVRVLEAGSRSMRADGVPIEVA